MKTRKKTDFLVWLQANGLTIMTFAVDVGLGFSTVSNYCRGVMPKFLHRTTLRAIKEKHPSCPLLKI